MGPRHCRANTYSLCPGKIPPLPPHQIRKTPQGTSLVRKAQLEPVSPHTGDTHPFVACRLVPHATVACLHLALLLKTLPGTCIHIKKAQLEPVSPQADSSSSSSSLSLLSGPEFFIITLKLSFFFIITLKPRTRRKNLYPRRPSRQHREGKAPQISRNRHL